MRRVPPPFRPSVKPADSRADSDSAPHGRAPPVHPYHSQGALNSTSTLTLPIVDNGMSLLFIRLFLHLTRAQMKLRDHQTQLRTTFLRTQTRSSLKQPPLFTNGWTFQKRSSRRSSFEHYMMMR
jgi:hypothetical protein